MGVDALAGDDTILLLDGTGTGTYQGNTGNDVITLDNLAATSDYSAATIDGGADDDTINLLNTGGFGSTIGDVLGGTGDDTITLDGAAVVNNIESGDGSDVIDLDTGTVGGFVFAGAGDDTITLNGASITMGVDGQADDDTILLLSGSANTATGSGGNDLITLNGASITTLIDGGADDDTILLLSGSAGAVGGFFGDDTITLDGASVTGTISGDDGSDVIVLLSGSANSVDGGDDGDTITLNGASIAINVSGGAGDDVINLLSGSAFNALGNDGNDIITLAGASLGNQIHADAGDDVINVLSGEATAGVSADAGEDTINLNGGTVLNALGGDGNDAITLNGGTVTAQIDGDGGNDVIGLFGGSAADVFGDVGNDLITLNGAVIAGVVAGNDGDDTIDLIGGSAGSVTGDAGHDLITLTGGSIGTFIDAGAGNDVVNLNGGMVGTDVLGGDGEDTITLAGADVTGDINGGAGHDSILLLGGTADDVFGDTGNDVVTLNGAVIANDIDTGADDDVINLIGGSFGNDLLAGTGSDTATINPGFDLTSIMGTLDGGDDAETADGDLDRLNVIGQTGSLTANNVINWESILLNGSTITLGGTALVTSETDGFGVLLANSLLDLGTGLAITGDVTVDATSTVVADAGGGIYSISDDLNLDGTLDLSDGASATDMFTVSGDYNAVSASLLMDAALDATEAGDNLAIGGTIGGVTTITITDTNPLGAGAFTGTGPGAGIALVDNSLGGDIAEGDFLLAGGEIVKVPFTYRLSLESDDILYLQSDVLSQVYGYAILAEVMREDFPLLRDRLGDRRYGRLGGAEPSVAPEDSVGVWARIDGTIREIEHDGSFTTGEWESSRAEAEIGLDMPLDLFGGAAVAGVSVHAIHGNADARSGLTPDAEKADVGTKGFGAGLSLAWFPGGGFYADLQGRVTVWDADVEVASRDLDEDVNAVSWGASLEVGNRLSLGGTTSVIPRGRAVYTDVDFSSFTDSDGVEVSQDKSASLVLEAGVTVEQLFMGNVAALFVDASVAHDVLKDSSIEASGFGFQSGLEATWGQLQIGLQGDVAEDASVYIAADIGSPFGSQFGDTFSYGMEAGFRLDF